jgi:hypothetical protein
VTDDDLRSLWKQQASDGPRPSAEEVRARSEVFARKIASRNRRETIAATFVMVVFTVGAVLPGVTLMHRLGCVSLVLAAVFVVTVLRRKGSAGPPPADDAPTAERLAHHRAELGKQRDLLARAGIWYVGPFVPGLALLFADEAISDPAHRARMLVVAALVSAFLVGVVALNRRAARALGREIDALGG